MFVLREATGSATLVLSVGDATGSAWNPTRPTKKATPTLTSVTCLVVKAVTFRGRVGEFLMRSRTGSELSPEEKALWIQSGLAVSPLMGTCLQYSLHFCLARTLIGEWTFRVLLPVSKAFWPRHGRADALLQNYQCRTPQIVAWARAAFEQGVLPSLLMMPGLAPVFGLPGDRMFQATEVTNSYQRPAIIHAYGGAKTGMERSLASIAPEGWLPMAAAMLGTNVGQCWTPSSGRYNH